MTVTEQYRATLHRLAFIARSQGDRDVEARLCTEIWASAKEEAKAMPDRRKP